MKEICAAFLAALVLFSVGCASRYSAPVEDVNYARRAGTAVVTKFVEHYRDLYEEGRPPTDAEYGYWSAAYENLKAWYQFLLGKVREDEVDGRIVKDIATTFFGRLK